MDLDDPIREVRQRLDQADEGLRVAVCAPTSREARFLLDRLEDALSSEYRCRRLLHQSRLEVTDPLSEVAHTVTWYALKSPDRLRGPVHHLAWAHSAEDPWPSRASYDNLRMGLRLPSPGSGHLIVTGALEILPSPDPA